MELKFEEIAPYLPYGLKAIIRLREDSSLPINDECIVTVSCFEVAYLDSEYDEFKPILKPLSYFSVKRIARDIMEELQCDLSVVIELWDLYDKGDLDNISIKTYNVMCKNHIDFNRLIEKGLAININTLK
jgi:hypothetical protein